MKTNFLINCGDVKDVIYDFESFNTLPLLTQLRIRAHLLFCTACSREFRNFSILKTAFRTDFLPPPPNLEDAIMNRLYEKTNENFDFDGDFYNIEEITDISTGFSFKLWVIIGFFVLLSLSSAFFGMNFIEIADIEGLSFLLPIGITIGMVVTCYGALLIGSHLKELSTRFRLH